MPVPSLGKERGRRQSSLLSHKEEMYNRLIIVQQIEKLRKGLGLGLLGVCINVLGVATLKIDETGTNKNFENESKTDDIFNVLIYFNFWGYLDSFVAIIVKE